MLTDTFMPIAPSKPRTFTTVPMPNIVQPNARLLWSGREYRVFEWHLYEPKQMSLRDWQQGWRGGPLNMGMLHEDVKTVYGFARHDPRILAAHGYYDTVDLACEAAEEFDHPETFAVLDRIAQATFREYSRSVDYKAFNGQPIPEWSKLPYRVRAAHRNGASAGRTQQQWMEREYETKTLLDEKMPDGTWPTYYQAPPYTKDEANLIVLAKTTTEKMGPAIPGYPEFGVIAHLADENSSLKNKLDLVARQLWRSQRALGVIFNHATNGGPVDKSAADILQAAHGDMPNDKH